jgi:hypothetical protein
MREFTVRNTPPFNVIQAWRDEALVGILPP